MNIGRRSFVMSGAAALLSLCGPASAQEQEEGMVLRRSPRAGEDPEFFRYGQAGRLVPIGRPLVIEKDFVRTVVHFPRFTRKARLVVFSHGALGDPQVYRQLIDHWVSHGYVVIAPIHDDSVFERGLLARRSNASGATVWEVDRFLNDPAAWDARADACRRVLEDLDRYSETIDLEISDDRPIIFGHEFGAFVVQILMGARVSVSATERRNFEDPRWFAGGMLSPQGVGIMGLDETSWNAVSRPLLIVQGAKESDFTLQRPSEKIGVFTRVMPGNKHLAWFTNGDRLLYSGPRAGTSVSSVNEFESVKAVTAAFLDAYSNYNVDTFNRLVTDWIDRSTLDNVVTRYR